MPENNYIEIEPKLRQCISTEQAWHYCILPKSLVENQLELYYSGNNNICNELELILGRKIKLYKIDEPVILENLNRYYQKPTGNNQPLKQPVSDDFISKIILEAKNLGSSDIHFEPFENGCRVRIRIDGQLIERYVVDKAEYPALINKIKIKSNLDIAEKRLPQDGRIFFSSPGSKIDLRVSIMPTLFGEKAVLRILSKDATSLNLKELGLNDKQLENYMTAINLPYGIILISGPTGSGKTTSLYATLKTLNKSTSNILTIEDPIEYTLEGINQVQLNEAIGLTFAKALRTFLRQDPDIIMLGEIRDDETAQMAIRASLTGHLVLSTIHTNTALGIISRLTDMGIPPFLLKSTLNLAVSQRLLRLLCDNCKEIDTDFDLNKHTIVSKAGIEKVYKPTGCPECYYTGYKGRRAIYEVIPVYPDIIAAVDEGKKSHDEILQEYKIQSLPDSAVNCLKEGVTSFEEIYSIIISKQTD